MRATAKNNKNKIEKHQKIKPGDCIFPFKYKWKMHDSCYGTDKGDICATEINLKTRTLKKYGYCEYSKKKMNQTLKKTNKDKPVSKPSLSKTTMSRSPISKTQPIVYNDKFIQLLTRLQQILTIKKEHFRANAYKKAAEAILMYPEDITNPDQISHLKGIGSTILEKLHEYVDTGKINYIQQFENNPINVLTKVHGIGIKNAEDLIKKGIDSISKLRDNTDLLNKTQKIGLKYYDDILKKIPRTEIDNFKKILQSIDFKNIKYEIVGSYRRGLPESGDIDIILTTVGEVDPKLNILRSFVDKLIEKNIIIYEFAKGKFKNLALARLTPGGIARRVDFLYTLPENYAFAILYFTGSKDFNTAQRRHAIKMGYSLNDKHISRLPEKSKKQTKQTKETKQTKQQTQLAKQSLIVSKYFPDEQSIFKFLNLQYVEPQNRIDGTSIKILDTSVKTSAEYIVQPQQQPQQQPPSKSKHNTTVKKSKHSKLVSDKDKLELFKQQGVDYLSTLTDDELQKILYLADNLYYSSDKPILSDDQYDVLKQYISERSNKSKQSSKHNSDIMFRQDGLDNVNVENLRNKVKLPYEMWSMNKIKPDTKALSKWIQKYKGPYVLSCKLDGVSGLYTMKNTKQDDILGKLYTRGNGKVGQDISNLIPYLNLNLQIDKTKSDTKASKTSDDIVVRGEFIITREKYNLKYKDTYSNPRNFIAGIINSKKINPEIVADVDFVAYELIKPIMKPSEQLHYIKNVLKLKCVEFQSHETISNNILSDRLIDWRKNYQYEIDGVICTDDNIYKRTSSNPKHAFAFKMVLNDQFVEAQVVQVLWNPSKDGYLKPRIKLNPVTLNGVVISYVTGFNAKYIVDNKIGVGTILTLIRSGDVIPHILNIVRPAPEPQLPTYDYVWNSTKVDFILRDASQNKTVKSKIICGFFAILKVDQLGCERILRLIENNYDTIPKILKMTVDDFKSIKGFQDTLSINIHTNIQNSLEKITLSELMQATNIFGHGFGEKKFELILKNIPNILTSKESDEEKIKTLISIKGIGVKTATEFVKHINPFMKWIQDSNLQHILHNKLTQIKSSDKKSSDKKSLSDVVKNSKSTKHILFQKKWTITGARDTKLLELLKRVGAEMQNEVNSKTEFLIAEKKNTDTKKIITANKLNVPILNFQEVYDKYFSNITRNLDSKS